MLLSCQNMGPLNRTTSGCWTCRIRKKKCDEIRPSCGPCTYREITCHGYGEKPRFMFREEDQKAEIEKIQKAVHESLRARRAFRVAKKHGRVVQPRAIALLETGQSDAMIKETSYLQQTAELNSFQLSPDQRSIPSTQLPILDPWPTTFINRQQSDFLDGLNDDLPTTDSTLNTDLTSSPAPSNLPSTGGGIWYPYAFYPGAPLAENANDLEAVMNYLDNIFPLQYYFYQPSAAERGRGWLLSMLLRSKPLYYTAMAFSSVQKVIASRDDSVKENHYLEELDLHHSSALAGLAEQLAELPRLNGDEHLRLGIDILACTIQLLSIEIFRGKKWWKGWKGDWEIHTSAAGALLSVIGNDLDQSASSGDSTTSDDGPDAPSNNNMPGFLSEIAGLDFWLSSYVWSDIMRSANVGLKTSLQGSSFYINYLEEDRIQLDRLMGCRNWAMLSIREISGLEAKRSEMLSSLRNEGQSDIEDRFLPLLKEQSNPIEARLQRGLTCTLSNLDGLSKHDREVELVTHVFGLAAVIYLDLVVSSSFGKLPEVQQDVAKALSALMTLPKYLLMRVAWPFCVTGCMAKGDSRAEFAQLLSETKAGGHPMGQLWNALDLMEEFWKLRELMAPVQLIKASPWLIAMESMHMKTCIM